MKLTIEETDGGIESIPNIRCITANDTQHVAVVWWEQMDGKKHSYKDKQRKPRRIVLEFEDEAFPASVNYGQVRREE